MFDFINSPLVAVAVIFFIPGCFIGGLVSSLFKNKGAEVLHDREVARHRTTKHASENYRKIAQELEQKVEWLEAQNTRLRRQLGMKEGDDK